MGPYGNKLKVFEEKVGLVKPFEGNYFTRHGEKMEPVAVAEYQQLVGCPVTTDSFRVYSGANWMGGSPDGLLPAVAERPPLTAGGLVLPPGRGLLEVKCPKTIHPFIPTYYVPQVQASGRLQGPAPRAACSSAPPQAARARAALAPTRRRRRAARQGLMEIYDLDWCHFLIWRQDGYKLYEVPRDREYFDSMFEALRDLWVGHIEPGMAARDAGASPEEIRQFAPGDAKHANTAALNERADAISKGAALVWEEEAKPLKSGSGGGGSGG